jgi:NTP pyrophosphatase (non-canonical NTP hydrolase)
LACTGFSHGKTTSEVLFRAALITWPEPKKDERPKRSMEDMVAEILELTRAIANRGKLSGSAFLAAYLDARSRHEATRGG